MSNVFVVDTMYKPLNPVHPGWARKLLSSGKAAVFRRYPFTIILKEEVANPEVQLLRLKLDPWIKTTGIAIVNDASGEVVFAAELQHRGHAIKESLDKRRAVRHSRRQRKTRYRASRFNNRKNKQKGWLPPSIESRILNTETWVRRLMRYCPIIAISQELVKFDMQHMNNPEISGVEYQQGDLQGYEVREYLLEKWKRQCAYCGAKDVPLQVEHIQARANGGTDRVSNLTLACEPCNRKKGKQDIKVFLKNKPDILKRILAQAKSSLKDAAAVNMTRWALYRRLQAIGMPIECGSGGRTKFNRTQRNLPKAHWIDAACVGASTPEVLITKDIKPLLIKATGHGCRQMCTMNETGFPRTGPKQFKIVKGFQTGDIAKVVVSKGKKAGTYIGKVSIRSTGRFNIITKISRIEGIGYQHFTMIHQCDGYSYQN